MAEAASAAVQGGVRSPPTVQDALVVARALVNELDAARFDPLLVRAIARSVNSTLENLVARVDALVRRAPPLETVGC